MKKNNMIPVTRPFFDEREALAARSAIRSGWVTQGPYVKKFEQAFAQYVDSPYACATTSCTSALHLGLLAVGVKPGDVVVTVSHSFIATANCARYCMAEPVFVDVEPDGFNMCPRKLQEFLEQECVKKHYGLVYRKVRGLIREESPLKYFRNQKNFGRVGAIVVVHQLGFPCDLKAILSVARRFGIPVVEDAAYAVGSEISLDKGKTFERIGKPHGDVACFSFHPRKMLVTGEGGMLTTRNPKYDKFFRLLRHQGMSVSDLARHKAKKIIFEQYVQTAYNYRMTDIQAAIGCEQIKKMPLMLKRRCVIAQFYQKALRDLDWALLPDQPDEIRYNWSNYPVRLKESAPFDQQRLMQYLLNHGIALRPGVMNSHHEKPYRSTLWHLPQTEKARQRTILLPIFPQLNENQLKKITQVIKNA